MTVAAASVATGCSDVGDSSAVSNPYGNVSDARAAPDSGVEDAEAPDSTVEDTGALDSTVQEAGAEDTGAEDTRAPDSMVEDTGAKDTGVPDSTVEDTGVKDTGTQDSAVEETGAEDSGTLDSSVDDTGAVALDAGTGDDGTLDSAVAESGIGEAGVADDASDGGGLLPCTAASQTRCVPCAGNITGLCTPTEAAFVQHDIDNGNATPAGGDGVDGCYACLLMAGCIDDTEYSDHGIECGDLTGTFNAGAQAGTADPTLCLATLACILRTSCAAGGVSVDNCYCGPTHAGSACAAAGSAVDGACLTPEVNGLGFDVSDNTDILKNFDDNTRPAGMANQTFQCAVANSCNSCLQ